MTFREFEKRLFRWTLKGLLVAAVFVVSSYFGFWGYTAYREWRLMGEWEETVGSAKLFEGSLVREETNGPALRLEELLAPVGIAFAARSSPSGWKATPWTYAAKAVRAYVERELERPESEVGEPPAEVAAFLEAYRPVLDEVRDLLLATPEPLWAQDQARMWGVESPNQLAFVHMAEWLLADGLQSIRGGDPARATRDLDATGALVRATGRRMEMPCQAATLALRDFQVGFLRKLDPAPPEWKEKLGTIFGGADLKRAFAYEAFAYMERGRRMARIPFYHRATRRERLFWRTFGRLWYRLNMVDVAQRYLEEMRLLESLGPCAYDYNGQTYRIAGSLPWWNSLKRVGIQNLGYYWERGMKLEADAEMTAKILRLRDARDENGGNWPETVAGVESARCPGSRFEYGVRSGRMTLTFRRALRFEDKRGKITLPLQFTSRSFSAGQRTGTPPSCGPTPMEAAWAR